MGFAQPTHPYTVEGATVSSESIIQWIVGVTANLLRSQSSTLAALVAAAIRTERPNLARIGREMAGPATAKSTIKRVWRFTCNERIEVSQAMAGVITKLVSKRKKRLLISLDWTEVRDFHTLMAAACIGGRAVPLLWFSFPEWKLVRSQNSLEISLLRHLRALIPASVRVVVLADRGFGRAEWAAECQELGFDYVVRIRPDVTVRCSRYRGVLRKYPVRRGIAHVLRDVQYRKDARVRHNLVIRWRPGLPKKRDEPWYLMTSLDRNAESLCQLYACRMSVEELFRDQKNRRNGWSLRNTRIQHAERFDRFLLILAFAYILLVGLGLQARLDHNPSQWCTNTRHSECSVFTIGKALLARFNYNPDDLLRRVRYATEDAGSKWG
jgi:Transposase DDE domain